MLFIVNIGKSHGNGAVDVIIEVKGASRSEVRCGAYQGFSRFRKPEVIYERTLGIE